MYRNPPSNAIEYGGISFLTIDLAPKIDPSVIIILGDMRE